MQKDLALGRQLAAEVKKHATVITDPAINGYVNRIAQKVAASAGLRWPLTIKVATGLPGYATTLPGGFFFINADLIQTAASESELAGVIAHQIGHLALLPEPAPPANRGTIPMISLGEGGLCLRGIAHPVIPMPLLATQREVESQADVLGLNYMAQAGYDPRALASFFERVLQPKPGNPTPVFEPLAVLSAPTRSQAEAMTKMYPLIVTTSEFGDIRQRLAAIMPEPAAALRKPPSLLGGR